MKPGTAQKLDLEKVVKLIDTMDAIGTESGISKINARVVTEYEKYHKSRHTKSEDKKKQDRIIATISDTERVCPICHNAYSSFLSLGFLEEVGSFAAVKFGLIADVVTQSLKHKRAFNPHLCIECAMMYHKRVKRKRYAKIRNMVRKLQRSLGKEPTV